jgi:ankyrin repeat protein
MDIKISVIRPHLEVMYSPQYNMYKNSINACLYDKLEVAKFLVSSGADISAVNDDGSTPLKLLNGEKREEMERYALCVNMNIKPAKR